MYAIFEDGARQYRAEEGKVITIDYRDVKTGDTLELTKVLLVESGGTATIGQPHVNGAKVITEVVDFPKTKTVTQKFRRRKNSKRLTGHTQPYVRVKVKQIVG
ncbi:MAG TPA: 50S ribosomal protein L21 [Fimbriiglobus sp.]|jgi:large subunit ribosomal protein L21